MYWNGIELSSLNNCSQLIGEVAGPRGAEDKKEKPRGAPIGPSPVPATYLWLKETLSNGEK